jgi:hypothetical protein
VLLEADQESRFTINEASEKELLTNPKVGVNTLPKVGVNTLPKVGVNTLPKVGVNTLDKMWSTANKPTKCLIEDD